MQWEKVRLEAEAAALRECTFAPKAVANNRRHLAGYVPIQDRLGELQRRKRCTCLLVGHSMTQIDTVCLILMNSEQV